MPAFDNATRTAAGIAVAGLAIGMLAPAASGHPMPMNAMTVKGPTYTYDTAYDKARTKVKVWSEYGMTKVALDVAGLPESAVGKVFGVHVHENRCGPDPADAGQHYQDPDAAPGTPLHAKEIWLDVRVGPDGRGQSDTVVPWTIGAGQAGSVVLHALPTNHETGDAGDRLLCTTVPFGG
jgi:superoxide dismutase, Cu-Zn family